MLDYRNILRVGSDLHKSMRTMEQELRSSHRTIRKVLDAVGRAGIVWPLSESVTNEMLMELLFPEEYQKTALYVLPDYSYIHAELARKGVNMTLLWEEYFAKCNANGTVPYDDRKIADILLRSRCPQYDQHHIIGGIGQGKVGGCGGR